jgi:hypothetical protein
MPILHASWRALIAAAAGAALQASSPYTFGGIELPMNASEIAKRLHAKALCNTHAKTRITACTAKRVKLTGAEAGVYDVMWNINDPTGKVAAVVFTRRDAPFSSAQLDAMRARWGKPDQNNTDVSSPGGFYVWWGKALSARWSARVMNLSAPSVMDVTITDNTELAETNRRAAKGQH